MTDRISPRQFLESPGVADWRLVQGGGWVCGHFRTGSFGVGIALVGVIGQLADALDHPADVDLRPESVSVRLFSGETVGLSTLDLEMARQISAAARELDVSADPGAVQHVEVVLHALAPAEVRPFWRAVLGYAEVGDEGLIDPHRQGPSIWFQQTNAPRPERGRIHLVAYVPQDQAEARIAAALAAGGRVVSDADAPAWWTLADPVGNEVDVAVRTTG